MLGSEGKPPAAVIMAQIIHDATMAKMICILRKSKSTCQKQRQEKPKTDYSYNVVILGAEDSF